MNSLILALSKFDLTEKERSEYGNLQNEIKPFSTSLPITVPASKVKPTIPPLCDDFSADKTSEGLYINPLCLPISTIKPIADSEAQKKSFYKDLDESNWGDGRFLPSDFILKYMHEAAKFYPTRCMIYPLAGMRAILVSPPNKSLVSEQDCLSYMKKNNGKQLRETTMRELHLKVKNDYMRRPMINLYKGDIPFVGFVLHVGENHFIFCIYRPGELYSYDSLGDFTTSLDLQMAFMTMESFYHIVNELDEKARIKAMENVLTDTSNSYKQTTPQQRGSNNCAIFTSLSMLAFMKSVHFDKTVTSTEITKNINNWIADEKLQKPIKIPACTEERRVQAQSVRIMIRNNIEKSRF